MITLQYDFDGDAGKWRRQEATDHNKMGWEKTEKKLVRKKREKTQPRRQHRATNDHAHTDRHQVTINNTRTTTHTGVSRACNDATYSDIAP